MTRDILLVTGVSGCGKDFLLDAAKRHDSRIGMGIPVVSMGSAIVAKMNQTSVEGRTDRDRIKHLVSNDTMRGIVRSIVADLVEYPAAIVNGHITYRQQGELISNPDIDSEFNPAAYAVVVADPKHIALWRTSDLARSREAETIDQIAYHQDFTIQTAERMATILGAQCRIIENIPGNAGNSSLALATMVSNICPK